MKSFGELYDKWEASPDYLAEQMAVRFLAELGAAMKENGVNNTELARRIGSSPAYITKVFRGPSNLSVETIAKLATAVGMHAHLSLEITTKAERWYDVFQEPRSFDRGHKFDPERFADMLMKMKPMNQDSFNDEKFALAA